MNDQRFYSLIELKAAADEACKTATERRREISDGVNWADLACVDAREWTNHKGERGYTVLIEEASPDASELQRFVEKFLCDRGFDCIEVLTEW